MVAAASGGHVWVSQDYGVSWTPRFREGPVNSVSVSGDGRRILVAVPWHPSLPDGRVSLSEDGGETWAAMLYDANWRAVALSADGRTMLAADNPGRVHVARGGASAVVPVARLTGGEGDTIELVYAGGGVFQVRSYRGLSLQQE